jgi:hypothetical protein
MKDEKNEHTQTLSQPQTQEDLRQFVDENLHFRVPAKPVCQGHCAPMDYLWHAYHCDLGANHKSEKIKKAKRTQFEPQNHGQDAHAAVDNGCLAPAARLTSGDCIVWANRGGGKTQLAATATLLEGLFKPGCQTRILAGSLDQSCRTYEYLCEFVDTAFADRLDGRMLKNELHFKNGAAVRALAQSMRAVRGRHIHKLRCDEIELFDEEIYAAARYITHSKGGLVAAIESLSTMHRPYGLMQKLVDNAETTGVPVFRWCLWETIEICTPDRSCSRCELNSYCQGKARNADGYLNIDDSIAQMKRSSRIGFESEMLCLRPNTENAVFSDFDPTVHVAHVPYDPALPLYRAMDFGFRNPFVCLWIQVTPEEHFRVIGEYSASQLKTADHAVVVKARTPCPESQVVATFCDPAGASTEQVSGRSSIDELRHAGIRVKSKPSQIMDGIEKIRAALRSGDGQVRLVVDAKCTVLIKSLRCYHYRDSSSKVLSELPEKDGENDHAVDALRYFFINYQKPAKVDFKNY